VDKAYAADRYPISSYDSRFEAILLHNGIWADSVNDPLLNSL